MATIRLVPSTYAVSSESYLSVSGASNMYTNTDSTTYATITNTNASTSSRYLYLRGFNFGDIPSSATVSSFTVKIKGYESGLNTSTSYAPRLANGTSALSNTTATSNFGTSTTTITIPTGSLTWQQIKNYGSNFTILVYVRRNQRNTTGYFYCYGAEIEVTYTAEDVHPTSVTLDSNSLSLEEGETHQLTETVLPSNATNKNVTWSSSNTSVATVSNGLVTAVSAGSATITVATVDGNKTATCAVTVAAATYVDYVQTNTLSPGKSYIIANGNTGSVYMLSNEANGSRTLKGVSATISNGKLSVRTSQTSKVLFDCELYTTGDPITTCLSNNSQYLYSDNASGLRMYTSPNNKHWHYESDGNKFWLYRGTTNGYTDDTTEYKYYLQVSSGNFTDNHIGTTGQSIENTTIPAMYLFVEDTGSTGTIYFKANGSWVAATKVYKKVNGSWVEQTDLTNVFNSSTNYKKG